VTTSILTGRDCGLLLTVKNQDNRVFFIRYGLSENCLAVKFVKYCHKQWNLLRQNGLWLRSRTKRSMKLAKPMQQKYKAIQRVDFEVVQQPRLARNRAI